MPSIGLLILSIVFRLKVGGNQINIRTLQRRFLKYTKFTILRYLQNIRLHKACHYIALTQKNIEDIAYTVGYQDVSSFRKAFQREYGLSPSEYRHRFGKII